MDAGILEYAEHVVAAGKAASVSAVFNDAVTDKRIADQRPPALLRERARQADPARVTRMTRHVNRQLTEHGFPAAQPSTIHPPVRFAAIVAVSSQVTPRCVRRATAGLPPRLSAVCHAV